MAFRTIEISKPAIGIHHSNQLNAFNLADDLIEPFRPMVDLVAISMDCENFILNKEERMMLAQVIHAYCGISGRKERIYVAVNRMIESLKEILFLEDETKSTDYMIALPNLLQYEVSARIEE